MIRESAVKRIMIINTGRMYAETASIPVHLP